MRMMSETSTKHNANAVMTAMRPDWFVFDITARGGSGVAEGVADAMLMGGEDPHGLRRKFLQILESKS